MILIDALLAGKGIGAICLNRCMLSRSVAPCAPLDKRLLAVRELLEFAVQSGCWKNAGADLR